MDAQGRHEQNLCEISGASPMLHTQFLLLLMVAIVLTIGSLVCAVQAWRDRFWSVWARVHYTLIALAAFVFIPFLYYWNLLGFHF